VIKDYGSKDQRSYELSLSNSGFNLYQQLVPIALAHEKRMMANLSLNERNDLLALLSKLDNTSV
jgi:DNA-binding MarR family transcriptional regulator